MDIRRVFHRARAWGRSILGRTVLFSLAMLLLTLTAAGLVTTTSQEALRNEIVARNTAQAEAVVEQLALSLGKTMDIQRETLYDTDINRLGVAPGYYTDPQRIMAMLRAEDRMRVLTSSSPLIDQSFFMAPAIGKTITEGGVDTLSEDDFERFSRLCAERQAALTESDGEFYILMAFPIYSTYLKENGPLYLLGVKLNQRAIDGLLSSRTSRKEEVVYLFTEDGMVIGHVNEAAIPVDEAALFEAARMQNAFDAVAGNGVRCLACAARSAAPEGMLTLISVEPYDLVFSVLNRQGRFFMALILIQIAATVAYMIHIRHVIHKPLNKLADAFRQVEQGDFSVRIHHDREDDFAAIYHQFNRMNGRLKDLIEQVYMQTIRTQRAELKQLQSQINPHFLYNNLFMIRSLAQLGDTDMIETLAADLGEYFRYINRTGSQEVPLSMETAHARNYAQLQDMRFSSRIHLDFEPLPESLQDVTVPRLVLQPLIENAYQHGLKDTLSGGELHIGFRTENRDAVIVVEDNGPGMTEELIQELTVRLSNPDAQETTGMINIHRRLRLRFGEAYGLSFSVSPLGGLRAEMRIPLDGGEAADAQGTDR
ncbi:MAG: sensor histidine kinase [Clostridia bacterium]|nr:sensor histidine kinase [Clostridia bacterium]